MLFLAQAEDRISEIGANRSAIFESRKVGELETKDTTRNFRLHRKLLESIISVGYHIICSISHLYVFFLESLLSLLQH